MTMTVAIFPPNRRSLEVRWRYLKKREWRQKAKVFCACGVMEAKAWSPMCAGAHVRRRVVSAYYNSIAPFHPFNRWLGGSYLRIIAGFTGFCGRRVSLHLTLSEVKSQAPMEQWVSNEARNSVIVECGGQTQSVCLRQKGACCA